MIVEMIINRGWSIQVDGQKPNAPGGWEVGENGHVSYVDSDGNRGPLDFGALKMGRVRLLRKDDEEIDWEDDYYDSDNVPAKLYINEPEDGGFWLPITIHVAGHENGLCWVTTADGVKHDIDEVTTYIRADDGKR